jgi:hypothetical protein
MNLRHIDPRSTDWMDAMLEGEPVRLRKREPEPKKIDGDPDVMAAAKTAGEAAMGSRPPPHPLR